MNNKVLIFALGLMALSICAFQEPNPNIDSYAEEIEVSRTEKNKEFKISEESPLTDKQKEIFKTLSYYPISEKYKVSAKFLKNDHEQIVMMAITHGSQRGYFVYGTAHFQLEGRELDLIVYKPVKSLEDYLFIPFYDETSADLTYGGGRYLEPIIIDDSTIEIDFNLAYNPYCAYNHAYRCPIPPPDNKLKALILAGEKIPDFTH